LSGIGDSKIIPADLLLWVLARGEAINPKETSAELAKADREMRPGAPFVLLERYQIARR
jgi:hypothetical protein